MKYDKNIKRLEMHISYSCDNNCIFCSESKQLDKFRGEFIEFKKIKETFNKFSKTNINHVTFTGGEPTLHPDFSNIIKLAKQKKLTTYVTTNGGQFTSTKFTEKTIPFLDEICFSVHGHDEDLHNRQTRNKNSFENLVTALENVDKIKEKGGFVNIVITKKNIDSVEKIIDFVSQYSFINQILISSIAPEGRGADKFKELVVPLSSVKNRVSEIEKAANSHNIKIRFFGLPLCALKSNMALSNDLHWDPRITIEKWDKGEGAFLKETISHSPDRKRTKVDKCQNCKANGLCPGIFERYIDLFGIEDITPID